MKQPEFTFEEMAAIWRALFRDFAGAHDVSSRSALRKLDAWFVAEGNAIPPTDLTEAAARR